MTISNPPKASAPFFATDVPKGSFHETDVAASNGRTLRVAEYGSVDGFPIVYCHGTPGSRLDRGPDPSVYEGYRLVSYDRPGYGRSDPDPGRTVASVARDVAAVADALGLERFSVFGVSGGGPHALGCGALLGDRVERVAVRCGVAPFDDPEFDGLEGIAEINVREVTAARAGAAASEEALGPIAEAIALDPTGMMDEVTNEVPDVDKKHLARADVREVIQESMVEAVRQGARGWVDDDLAFVAPWGFDLTRVQLEVRLWQGELDVLVPRSHGEYLAGKLPNARFELVPGYGHWMLDQVPAALRWLAGGD
jgi:pimeloyl-ACP methyl ester carboxylesterase